MTYTQHDTESESMTHEELVKRAEYLSGKPARKNRHGSGALRWLATQLDVSQSTISRWGSDRSSPVPKYALDAMDELERRMDGIKLQINQ
jgi:hypothetical protein